MNQQIFNYVFKNKVLFKAIFQRVKSKRNRFDDSISHCPVMYRSYQETKDSFEWVAENGYYTLLLDHMKRGSYKQCSVEQIRKLVRSIASKGDNEQKQKELDILLEIYRRKRYLFYSSSIIDAAGDNANPKVIELLLERSIMDDQPLSWGLQTLIQSTASNNIETTKYLLDRLEKSFQMEVRDGKTRIRDDEQYRHDISTIEMTKILNQVCSKGYDQMEHLLMDWMKSTSSPINRLTTFEFNSVIIASPPVFQWIYNQQVNKSNRIAIIHIKFPIQSFSIAQSHSFFPNINANTEFVYPGCFDDIRSSNDPLLQQAIDPSLTEYASFNFFAIYSLTLRPGDKSQYIDQCLTIAARRKDIPFARYIASIMSPHLTEQLLLPSRGISVELTVSGCLEIVKLFPKHQWDDNDLSRAGQSGNWEMCRFIYDSMVATYEEDHCNIPINPQISETLNFSISPTASAGHLDIVKGFYQLFEENRLNEVRLKILPGDNHWYGLRDAVRTRNAPMAEYFISMIDPNDTTHQHIIQSCLDTSFEDGDLLDVMSGYIEIGFTLKASYNAVVHDNVKVVKSIWKYITSRHKAKDLLRQAILQQSTQIIQWLVESDELYNHDESIPLIDICREALFSSIVSRVIRPSYIYFSIQEYIKYKKSYGDKTKYDQGRYIIETFLFLIQDTNTLFVAHIDMLIWLFGVSGVILNEKKQIDRLLHFGALPILRYAMSTNKLTKELSTYLSKYLSTNHVDNLETKRFLFLE